MCCLFGNGRVFVHHICIIVRFNQNIDIAYFYGLALFEFALYVCIIIVKGDYLDFTFIQFDPPIPEKTTLFLKPQIKGMNQNFTSKYNTYTLLLTYFGPRNSFNVNRLSLIYLM